MDAAEENKLVERVQAGDDKAFEAIYDAHFDWVFKRIRTKVAQTGVAEELAQDVFLRAFTGISEFQAGSNLGAWLNGITRNVLLEYYRQQRLWKKHAPQLLDDFVNDDYADLFITAERESDNRELLANILYGLPESQRHILVMRIGHGKPTSEVAQIVYGADTPENRHKVTSQLYRALKAAMSIAQAIRLTQG